MSWRSASEDQTPWSGGKLPVPRAQRSTARDDSTMVNGERLRISVTRDAGAIVVAFGGDLDVFVASDARSHLDEAMARAMAHNVEQVVIDASGLGFCDSTGLSVLVRAHDDAEGRGLHLVLRNLSDPLRELLRLTGLDALLDGQT